MNGPRPDPAARNLAAAFLAGDWDQMAMLSRGWAAVGRRFRFVRPLVGRMVATFADPPEWDVLSAFVGTDLGYRRAAERGQTPIVRLFLPVPRMRTSRVPGADRPELATVAAVADRLGVTVGRLLWNADPRDINRKSGERLRRYSYTWVRKPSGKYRLLEAPKPGLKRLQRLVLRHVLDGVPPHNTAHGFRPGRSVLTNAAPHCGRPLVVRFDLSDFFPSIPAAKVRAVFRSLGYPAAVARVLAGLCTTRTPLDVWRSRPDAPQDGSDHAAWQRLGDRHLPQGAPTSPALANLCAYRLDCRLAGLATAMEATYTRYADDLTFSGGEELAKAVPRLGKLVTAIAAEEGFAVDPRKTRVMGRGGRQHVTGVVVNVRPNRPRAEFDVLKATLTNCVRHGPAAQNRQGVPDFRAHLHGRIAHLAMLHPARGRKLWAIADRIAWA